MTSMHGHLALLLYRPFIEGIEMRGILELLMLACGILAFAACEGERKSDTNDGDAQHPTSSENGVLTAPQTLGTVYLTYEHGRPWHLYKRANPKARKYLYKILADPEQQRHHDSAWLILGFIGDTEDVKRLERELHSYHGVLRGGEREIVPAMFRALGIMCGRDIEAACDLVSRMQEPEYWRAVDYQWFDKPHAQRVPFAYENITRLMMGYALSRNSDLEERSESIIDDVKDPELRSRVKESLATQVFEESAKNQLRYADKPPSENEIKMVEAMFNGNLEHPGPAPSESLPRVPIWSPPYPREN